VDGDDLRQTENNKRLGGEARAALARLLKLACERGYHGDVSIVVQVKDGSIQTILERSERKRR
jgi:hypothetical protein